MAAGKEKLAQNNDDTEQALHAVNKIQQTDIVIHGMAAAEGQIRCSFSQISLRQMESHSVSDLSSELGGVLLGHVHNSPATNEIIILAALPVETDRRGPVHFTFTADSWAQIHGEKSGKYPDHAIVGWYHTHPNLGVFYSADDVIVHSAAFVLPWQVGMVIDPVRKEACLVGWKKADRKEDQQKLIALDGMAELLDQHTNSILPWRFKEAAVWSASQHSEYERTSERIYTPANDWPSLPEISPWWGVVLGALSLLISLILIIERIVSALGS